MSRKNVLTAQTDSFPGWYQDVLAKARVGDWAAANNVELAYVPTNASWLNRIEAQFQALCYFALDGTDHRSHEEQNTMIRRYIAWRNRNAQDKAPREVITRANVA